MDDPPGNPEPPAPRRRGVGRIHLVMAFALLVPLGGYLGVSYLVAERLTRPSNRDIIDARLVGPTPGPGRRTADGLTLEVGTARPGGIAG